jgi:O-antigen biosynthesis protein
MTDWQNTNLVQYSVPSFSSMKGTKVVFLIAGSGISGGLNIILHHAKALLCYGAEVVIAFQYLAKNQKAELIQWRPDAQDLRICQVQDLRDEKFDLAVATFWSTAYLLEQVSSERQLYFVQSLETRFFLNEAGSSQGSSSELLRCAATYLVGLPIVTVANWLANFLLTNTSSKVWTVRNGIDKALFQDVLEIRKDLKPDRRLSVLLEGSPTTPMKGNSESIQTLKKEAFNRINLLIASPTPIKTNAYSMPNLKILAGTPMSRMPLLYGQSDVLVKMSRVEGMFGPPLEAFHAGATAVVSAVTGFDEYCQTGLNSIVVPVDDFAQMGEAVLLLDEDRDLLAALQKGAELTANSWPDVKKSGTEFVAACLAVLNSTEPEPKPMRKLVEFENDFEQWKGSLSAEDLRAFELLVSLGRR